MPTATESFQYPMTLEELSGRYTVELVLDVDVTPGEPRVDYYPDGSGYPGSPDTAEFTARCTQFVSEAVVVDRDALNEGWFRMLDSIVQRHLMDDVDSVEERILEAV